MINENFVILGAVLNLVGGGSYIIDTLKGKTKPNKISWFIWALAPMIAFYAEIKQGVGIQSLMTFMVGFMPLLVFISSFMNKKAYWQLGTLDIICGTLSVIGIILWQITQIGNMAILFAILADGVAAVPTIVKSYKEPETESGTVFLMSAISAVITMLTFKLWNFEHYAFPAYIFGICVLLYSLIHFKWGKILVKQTSR